MITLHKRGGPRLDLVTYNSKDYPDHLQELVANKRYVQQRVNYLLGYGGPNYPVPAIPFDVTFTSYDIIMWRDECSTECVAAWFND